MRFRRLHRGTLGKLRPPCGFGLDYGGLGYHHLNFGFPISGRFIQGTVVFVQGTEAANVGLELYIGNGDPSNALSVVTFYTNASLGSDSTDTPFYLTVF